MGLEFSEVLLWGLVSVLFYYLFIHKSRRDKLLDAIPGPSRPPIIGHSLDFILSKKEDLIPMILKWCEEYGHIYKTFSGSRRFVTLTNPKHIEKLLTSTSHLQKGTFYDFLRSWLGDGLLMSIGQKWFQRRKQLTPAFHFKILEEFLPIFNQESLKMTRILRERYGNGQTFDVVPYLTRCTMDIICETAMGQALNAQEGQNLEYSEAIREIGEITQNRAFRPWLHSEFMYKMSQLYKDQQRLLKILHGFTDKVIQERKQSRKSKKGVEATDSKVVKDEDSIYFGKVKKKNAFLDLLLDVQEEVGDQELTDQNIREETDTFMFAGHDTTSVATSFALFALGAYPEIQQKVREELYSIFGDDKERPVTTEDLSRMKYLECVFKESLRLYPSVPFIQRYLTSDLKLDDKITLPADVAVAVVIYGVHRHPEYFPEPLLFKPERFSEGDGKMKHPYAYIPFSAGPKNCIGQKFAMMEAKVLLANILRNFKITSVKHPKDMQILTELTIRSPDGIQIKLTSR